MDARWRWLGVGGTALFGLAVGSASASVPGCYRTMAGAVAQAGGRGVEGYRLEAVERDVFSGVVWATVKSCGHPERPGVLMMAAEGGPARVPAAMVRGEAGGRALVMLAGTRVRLVEVSENTQVEVSAVAQTSGAVGDRIRVRLVPVSTEDDSDGGASWAASERFASGIVRSSGVVEVDAR